jgi:hypothetical protein
MADDARKCGVCGALTNEEPQQGQPPASGGLVAGIPGLPTQPQAPQPNYLNPGPSGMGAAPMGAAPMAGGEVRVTLAGDVYEVPPPSARGTGPGGYNAASGGRPGPAGAQSRPGPTRPRYGLPAEQEERSGGVPIWGLLIVLLIMGGGAAGAFWWFQKQQAPKKAAEKVMNLMVTKDWGGVYDMTSLSEETKKQISSIPGGSGDPRQSFIAVMTMAGGLFTIKDPKVGEVKTSGDTATASVSYSIDGMGQSRSETKDMPLKFIDGEWKLDGAGGRSFFIGGGGGGSAPGGGSGGGSGGGAPNRSSQ